MQELPLVARARSFPERIALRTKDSQSRYQDLLDRSNQIASELLGETTDLAEAHIAFYIPAGFDYVTTQWGIWRSGGVAVPLSLSATDPELEYTLTDSECTTIVTTEESTERCKALANKLGLRLLSLNELTTSGHDSLPEIDLERSAMILYTSGTTNKPKGVVSTHANIQAQIKALVQAWHWEPDDCIPLFLPLHHIHGIINITSCALWSGATIEPFRKFDPDVILDRVANGAYSVFMAVPTIYVKLIQVLGQQDESAATPIINGFRRMRLMISGSAALPATVHEEWTALTGQKLLERYGMTEIGMGLSNPYDGERRPGAVGQPLPNVQIRMISDEGNLVTEENTPGEIQVKGPCVFKEYWHKSDATADSFDDGWFRTGDIAVWESGYYRIMGRQSVDIIKSGGYKLSALEIESALLEHDAIEQCAVVGIPDATWGEAVAAAIVLSASKQLSLDQLRDWCKERVSHYKIPKHLLQVDELPRNAMGKVTKPAVVALF